ncbi:MAG: glycoside hydrolase family 2 TIM barrel-domain containing protein [Verrucomicrobiota bacterium]
MQTPLQTHPPHPANCPAFTRGRRGMPRQWHHAWRLLCASLCALGSMLAGGGWSVAAEAERDATTPTGRARREFDADWRFFKGEAQGASERAFDDTGWRRLDLPHDWSIEGPFDASNPSGSPGAYLPCGIGWYRKEFRLPPVTSNRMAHIGFDGVHMNSEVWINGHRLGQRPYGFIGFQYDISPYLDPTGNNVLAVRVDNSLQPAARWYTGSGINRHVWLILTDKLRVEHWGVQISSPQASGQRAELRVCTQLRNGYEQAKQLRVTQTLVNRAGERVAAATSDVGLAAATGGECVQSLELSAPELWSPDSPYLYTLRTELSDDSRVVDCVETPCGVRVASFDPMRGFLLNGEKVLLKGVCNHDDLGPLGTALWDRALERRLHMLKQMGCNALRTSHNPPPPELLEMCDRLGLLVIDETFDEWRRGWASENSVLVCGTKPTGKAKYGYHLYFDKWAECDLSDHLRRDRNHPSVILWSIGNEIPEAQKNGELATLTRLRDICHRLDPSRPVTAGCNQIAGANASGFAGLLDVVGYNEGGGSCFQYEADHARYPQRAFYASEAPHSLQTRGEYRTLSRYPEPAHQPPNLTAEEVFPETSDRYASSYDNAGVRISARDSWRMSKTLPFLAGEFRWTGFDYLGESGAWPRVIGNFGIIDLCNFPKDTYYFYQSQWSTRPMVHLLPHWTWPGKEGTLIPVWCYTNCDSVELFLNNKSLGQRQFSASADMHLQWLVPYQPGELRAVAIKDGQPAATTVTRSAGHPARLVLAADQAEMTAGTRDLSYVTVRVEDASGNLVPQAANRIKLELKGPGRLLGVGNGDPLNHESFQGNSICVFHGLALAIIATTGEAGEIRLSASSEGLPTLDLRLRSMTRDGQAR